ncbi:hypothetical protein K466DRAFT_393576 [Polyporus arcularius HHB13444]|uniref:Uncharacterized protein n=1 Tax=Polyporus arcularius HHB13444 TaxID=1314778 RepID=A0A5C3NRC6_9APHY|nr:hypothetical protein K466DRAFT_393576 [Polyporus arcularius HHB13444]
MYAIVARLRGCLPAGSKWIDVLSSMHDIQSTGNVFDHIGLIVIVSIILDIQAVGNRAVSETAQGDAISLSRIPGHHCILLCHVSRSDHPHAGRSGVSVCPRAYKHPQKIFWHLQSLR